MEQVVASVGDLRDGEMAQVFVGDAEVLLARVEGSYHAVGAYCPRDGGPLAEGSLSGARVMCPWHHSCFSVTGGDLLEPPSLDGLPRYAVRVEGESVIVAVPDEASEDEPSTNGYPRGTPAEPAARASRTDPRTFLVLGAGAAGAVAAETLREEGFGGRVVLVTREERLPYDRTFLSKFYPAEEAMGLGYFPMRDEGLYRRIGVEVLAGTEVERVDAGGRRVLFSDGGELPYDALLVATGSAPRRLGVPGEDLEGVNVLRAPEDADAIFAAVEPGGRAVVVGGGFVGLECASVLAGLGSEVTVVCPGSAPLERLLGHEVGGAFRALHEENGVRFETGGRVARFAGEAGRLGRVVLEGGRELGGDLVGVGVGARPVTGFLDGVERNADGSLNVDGFGRLTGPGGGAPDGTLYAAGDAVAFFDPYSGARVRTEHWRLAMQQGRAAARNMAGGAEPLAAVPFFWTEQYYDPENAFRYVGHAEGWDEVIVEGDLARRSFLAHYAKDGRVLAVGGMGRDRELCEAEGRIMRGEVPTTEEVRAAVRRVGLRGSPPD